MTKRKPMPEPRKCPACGANSETVDFPDGFENYVLCSRNNCTVSGPQKKTKRLAILAWNRMIEKPKG